MNRRFIFIFTGMIILFFLFLIVFSGKKDGKLHIVVCDVGQGDAILLIMPTQAQILIDGGPDKKVLECLSRHMPFWDRSLDGVILTHPHADHMFGLTDVVDRYHLSGFYTEEVKTGSDSQKLLEAKLADKKLSAKDLNKGDNLNDRSGVKIRILSPRLNEAEEIDHNIANSDLNNQSIVAILTYGNFSILLSGDAENTVLSGIKEEAGDINILKVPHHGSKNGMSRELLNRIKPETAVISVGKGNRYGHPAKESLDLLSGASSKILRTDVNGEIEIITDGKNYSINTIRN